MTPAEALLWLTMIQGRQYRPQPPATAPAAVKAVEKPKLRDLTEAERKAIREACERMAGGKLVYNEATGFYVPEEKEK